MVLKAHKIVYLLSALLLIFIGYLFLFTTPFYDDPARYEQLVVEAEQKPFCQGGILFFGSSSIRGWKQARTSSFRNTNLTMVGFGGGMLNHLTHYFDRIVVPRKPNALFIYAGENDVGAGVWSNTILNELKTLLRQVNELSADTQVYFMSIKPSPKRRAELSQQVKVNASVKALAEQKGNLHFIDVSTALFEDRQLKRELFHDDGIHLSQAGYEVWTKILTPIVDNIETKSCSKI